MDEDAPANATGTAVAGTGDDSSTVVVRKKKRLQDKLMRRMGIKETIDRVIPDLEYPKDEIRERANELKKLALKSKDKEHQFINNRLRILQKQQKLNHLKKKVLLYLKIKIQNNLKNMCQDYLIKIKRHTINI